MVYMKTIALINQKGGVAKTTTAAELAAGLTMQGKRILLIDSDPQGNLTFLAGLDPDDDYPHLQDVYDGKLSLDKAILNTKAHGDLIANNIELASADRRYVGVNSLTMLKRQLPHMMDRYDYCIIDAPPTLGVLSWNVLIAADSIIVPVNAAAFSIQGLRALSETLAEVRMELNPSLQILGILLTRYNGRTTLGRDAASTLAQLATAYLGTKLFTTTIRQGVALEDAQACQTTVLLSAPKSGVAKDYQSFIKEFQEIV